MPAKNDNITKDPVAAKMKSKRGKNKTTILKESLGLTNPKDMEQFKNALLVLATEFLTSKNQKIKSFAWKELLKYAFPQQNAMEVTGELNHTQNKIFVIPAFNLDNVSSN